MPRRRALRPAAGVVVATALVLTVGLVSTAAEGAGADKPPKVKLFHGKKVAPKHYRGDARNLPQLAPGTLEEFERPDEPIGFGGGKTAPAAAPVEAPQTQIPAPSTSFRGLDFSNWGAGWPPDPVGDVGPNHFIEAVNTSIGIYTKAGTQVAAFTFDSLWSAAGRHRLRQRQRRRPHRRLRPDGRPVDRRRLRLHRQRLDGAVLRVHRRLPDEPPGRGRLVPVPDPDRRREPPLVRRLPEDGHLAGRPLHDRQHVQLDLPGVRGWAFNTSDLESGAAVRYVVVDLNLSTYFSLLPSNMRGASPPAGRPNFFVSESQTAYAFNVFKFHVDYSGSGSTFTGPTNVTHTMYTAGTTTVPSPANTLDLLYERLMMQAQYRNLGGTESLWVNHTVRTSASGPDGIQWAQINVTGGTVATTPVQQQIYGNVGNDGLYRWMGSLAVDKDGNMALGYSASSSSVNPDIRYAGRLATDPLNTLPQGETSMLQGVTRGSQSGNCGGGICHRWGDYSAMSIDPDGCTFWYVNEYYETTGLNWQTRIGSFKFPGCSTADTNPPTASTESATTDQGIAVPITLQGSDLEACEPTFSVLSAPANGTLSPITNNACTPGSPNTDSASIIYTPNSGFSGADAFTYKVNDGTNDSAAATVSITVNATATGYDQAVLADSPAAYWRLGESSGTSAADASGSGNAGTYQNAPTLGAPGLISGTNTSVLFDGADDRVLAPDSTSLSPTGAVSVEAWARAASLAPSSGGYRTIVLKSGSYWLRVDNAGGVQRARFYIRDAGTYYGVTAAGVTIATGTTYHLVGTYDGTTLRIYVNGVEMGSAAHTGAVDDTTAALLISNPPGSTWDGRLDEVAVYGQALSATRVQAHFDAGGPPPADYPSLVLADSPAAYWRLGESSGTSAADASGSGNAGTYQNAPTLGAPGLISGTNTSVLFDGADDRVLAPDSTSLSPTGAVSVEAWARGASFASSSGGYRTIVLKSGSYWLRVDNAGGVQRARFYIRDAGTYYGVTAAGVTIATGTTYHLVGTYDGTTLRIYVNGVEMGSAAHTGAVDDTTAALLISNPPGSTWDGRLDEVAVYPTALSSTAIQQHYSQGLVG